MNTIRYLLARYLCIEIRYSVIRWDGDCWNASDTYFRDHASAMTVCLARREEYKQRSDLRWCVEREFVWAVKQNPSPTEGEMVLIDAFLWWPLTIKGETRWWCRAQYTMICHVNRAVDGYVSPFDWEVVDWVG